MSASTPRLPLYFYKEFEKETIRISKTSASYAGRYVVDRRPGSRVCQPGDREYRPGLWCNQPVVLTPTSAYTPPRSSSGEIDCVSYLYVTSDRVKEELGESAQFQFCKHIVAGQDHYLNTGLIYVDGKTNEVVHSEPWEGMYFSLDPLEMQRNPERYKQYGGVEIVHESLLSSCPYVDCESPGRANSAICLQRQIASITSQIKTYDEAHKEDHVDLYFKSQCQTPEDKDTDVTCSPTDYANYLEQYKKIIEVASVTFGVSRPLLACLIFQESKFDRGATSGTGAKGIAQFIEGTSNQINTLIRDNKNLYNRMLVHEGVERLKCDATYAGLAGKHSEYQDNWVTYFNVLLSDPDYRNRKPPVSSQKNYGSFGIPPVFTPGLGRYLPPMAIGAMATYLKYIEDDRTSDHVHRAFANNELEYLALLSAAYNAGDGIMATLPTSTNPKNAQKKFTEVVYNKYYEIFVSKNRNVPGRAEKKARSKVAEVNNHMNKIRECIKHAGDYK